MAQPAAAELVAVARERVVVGEALVAVAQAPARLVLLGAVAPMSQVAAVAVTALVAAVAVTALALGVIPRGAVMQRAQVVVWVPARAEAPGVGAAVMVEDAAVTGADVAAMAGAAAEEILR